MNFTRRSTSWVLVALQTGFSFFFCFYLSKLLPATMEGFNLFQAPTWFSTLVVINFGLAILLAFCALWKHELTAIVLLLAIHIVCPLLFFTDLTRNPYFTQIVLLNIWIAFLWIAWFWESMENKSFLFPKTVLDLPLFAFFCITTISLGVAFLTHEPSFYPSMFSEGLKRWLFLVLNQLAVFYIAVMLDDKWRGRFIWITFWIAGIAAAYGLMQFYGIERIWQKTLTPFANRPVSTFGNPNFLSSYLMLVIPLLTIATLSSGKTFKSAISLGLLVIVITGLIATMTRSTWVGSLASLSLLPFSKSFRVLAKSNMRRFAIFLVLISVCVIFWPRSKLGGYRNPLERVLELKEIKSKRGYHPWDQRILIWSCSFGMIKDHFLFGKGWGLMELFFPYYQGRMLFHPILRQFRTHANNSHNEVLEIWSQTGIVGMGIYTWLWVVLIYYGIKLARSDTLSAVSSNARPAGPTEGTDRSLWGWAFTTAGIGMFIDNFFGNVSFHFAVPGFLFWWQIGLLHGLGRAPSNKKSNLPSYSGIRTILIDNNGKKMVLWVGIIFLTSTCIFNFRREFQEIYYFRGFKISKTTNFLDNAREELESAWKWFPREVNTNYELSNAYARLAQQTGQMGLTSQSENWRTKSIWAYCESLRANAGYDEIYFNLAAMQSSMKWFEDEFPDFSLQNARGQTITESAKKIRGAIFNYSRTLAINPTSSEAYSYLGNVYLQDINKYQDQASQLFQQAVFFFPKNKDFWVNLAFLQIHSKKYAEAYESLKKGMSLDPFYELTRKNLRALLTQTNRLNDPLAEVDKILLQLNGLVQSKNWMQMQVSLQRAVEILPECYQLRFILGNVYFELKDWKKAEKEYLVSSQLDPSNQSVFNNLAMVYRNQNRIEDAKKCYEQILALNPGDENAKNQLKSISQ